MIYSEFERFFVFYMFSPITTFHSALPAESDNKGRAFEQARSATVAATAAINRITTSGVRVVDATGADYDDIIGTRARSPATFEAQFTAIGGTARSHGIN